MVHLLRLSFTDSYVEICLSSQETEECVQQLCTVWCVRRRQKRKAPRVWSSN